jgi:hypothetical protein
MPAAMPGIAGQSALTLRNGSMGTLSGQILIKCDEYHKNIDFCDGGHIISALTIKLYNKLMEHHVKLRKILKSMWANYCRTFKDVPPGAMF